MRTLIVGSAATSDPGFLADLSAQCDSVIAADGGGGACLAAGILPELLVGDLDSLAILDQGRLRDAGTRFVIAPAEKDVTDLDLAIAEARCAGAREIWATGVLGARLDHTLATIGSLARNADAMPCVFEPDVSAWILAPEGRSRLELSPPGALVSLFAVGGAAEVTCTGVRYPLSREVLQPLDSRGLSNIVEDDSAVVELSRGVLIALSVLTNGTLLARHSTYSSRPE